MAYANSRGHENVPAVLWPDSELSLKRPVPARAPVCATAHGQVGYSWTLARPSGTSPWDDWWIDPFTPAPGSGREPNGSLNAIRAKDNDRLGMERESESERNDDGPEPFDKTRFIESSARDLKHDRDDLRLGGLDLEAVHEKEHVHGHEADAFVPIQEGVVFYEAETVACGKGGQVSFGFEAPAMPGPSEGRLEEAIIPHAKQSTVFPYLIVVGGLDDRAGQPIRFTHGGYLASSRRALRYFVAVRS
jgi:hypothetical protein